MRPSVRSLRTALFALLGAALVQTLALPAFAADDDAEEKKKALSIARAKFQQGVESEQVGDWVGALKLFRDVGQTKMTPQVRFHIAVCEENLGHLIKALGGYQFALEEAKDPNAVPDTFRTQDLADKFRQEVEASINDLQARLPKVTIERGAGAEAATIELDGIPLGASSVGVEVPQDPGPHQVTARAPGYSDFNETVTLAEKESKKVTIKLDKNASATSTGSVDVGGGGPSHDAVSQPPSRLVPYIVGGVGIASLGASGVFLILRQTTISDLADNCNGSSCPPSQKDKYESLKKYNIFMYATAGVGVAALGTAVALIVLEPKQKKPPVATWHGVQFGAAPTAPGADVAGASVFGRF